MNRGSSTRGAAPTRRSSWTAAERCRRGVAGLVVALLLVVVPVRDANAQWEEDALAAAAMSLATALDLSSTFACRDPRFCAETNPIASPFYDVRHPGYLIAADAIGVAAITLAGRAMRRSDSPVLRRLWWVPAAAFTVGSLVAWRGNQSYLARCPECR